MKRAALQAYILLAAALLLGAAACHRTKQPPADDGAASGQPATGPAAPVAGPVAGNLSSEPALPVTIDEEPVPTDRNVIVDKRDGDGGKPSCALDVRYKGALDQPVTWNGEGCSALTVAFVDRARLDSLGRLAVLSDETRDDIARSGGEALYVEGRFAAALYPLNSAKQIYKVPLGD